MKVKIDPSMWIPAILGCTLVVPTPTSAQLTDLGFGLIYDEGQDITWLMDANLSKTSGYHEDGLMTWEEAQAWVETITTGLVSGWRLPTVAMTQLRGPSEFSYLFTEYGIGNTPFETNPESLGPFMHIGPRVDYQDFNGYWTGSEDESNSTLAWAYRFRGPGAWTNTHAGIDKESKAYVWAVHDGNVSLLPKEEFWAGYKLYPSADVDTGRWLGWLNVLKAPWVWIYSLEKWVYLISSDTIHYSPWVFLGREYEAPEPELISLTDDLIYQAESDLTWLADANYAKTSEYHADGYMTWNEAQVWVESLVIETVDGWRLPAMISPGGPSELSLLYSKHGISCTPYNTTTDLSGPFSNIPPHLGYYDSVRYWTETEGADNPLLAWAYTFSGPGAFANFHGEGDKEAQNSYTWAVHDGNVAELAAEDIWAGYPVDSGGYVDTDTWMGWISVDYAPWLWSFSLDKWIYVETYQIKPYGTWIYSSFR